MDPDVSAAFAKLKGIGKRNVASWNDELASQAFYLAYQAHAYQWRKTGERYIFHVLAVASTIANLHCDLDTLLAAILHDVVEDSEVSLRQIDEQFGETTADIVDALTKMAVEQGEETVPLRNARYLRKNVVGAASNLRVAYIKLADRLHNLTTLGPLRPSKGSRSLEETRLYYAPLAGELGILDIQRKLSSWCLKLEKPELYAEIDYKAQSEQLEFRHTLDRVSQPIQQELLKSGIMTKQVMRSPLELRLENDGVNSGRRHRMLVDWLARPLQICLILSSLSDCYTALRLIHSRWNSITAQFMDSASIPLPNGYRGIHTMVQTERGELVLFVLRTPEMHRDSEWGPLYRLVRAMDYEQEFKDTPQAELLQQVLLLDTIVEEDDSERFLEHLRLDILTPKISVFVSSQGIVKIPRGSTITDLFLWANSQKDWLDRSFTVNGNATGVDWQLQDGDVVNLTNDSSGRSIGSMKWQLGVTHMTAKAHSGLREFGLLEH